MKRLYCIPLLIMLLLGCKSNENDSIAAQSVVQSLAGKWLMTETEQIVGGKFVWQPVTTLTPVYIILSPEGILLDADGKASCCGPNELNINGSNFKIDPVVKQSYYNADCATVFCYSCPTMDIEQSGNEMIISYCQSGRVKYVKK